MRQAPAFRLAIGVEVTLLAYDNVAAVLAVSTSHSAVVSTGKWPSVFDVSRSHYMMACDKSQPRDESRPIVWPTSTSVGSFVSMHVIPGILLTVRRHVASLGGRRTAVAAVAAVGCRSGRRTAVAAVGLPWRPSATVAALGLPWRPSGYTGGRRATVAAVGLHWRPSGDRGGRLATVAAVGRPWPWFGLLGRGLASLAVGWPPRPWLGLLGRGLRPWSWLLMWPWFGCCGCGLAAVAGPRQPCLSL